MPLALEPTPTLGLTEGEEVQHQVLSLLLTELGAEMVVYARNGKRRGRKEKREKLPW